MDGLIGYKVGMTRIFTEEGISIPVTVVKIEVHRVTQIKNIEQDGYHAIQVTTGNLKTKHITKPKAGHFAKAGVKAGFGLWEFRTDNREEIIIGQNINLRLFVNSQKVNITGISKGKGFAGTVKRWNFSIQDATHGNSLSHRAPGSIGQNQTPGKVFKGKKMAGRLGNERITVQNLTVIKIDLERNLLLVKGAVPGASGSTLIVKRNIGAKR